MHEDETIGTDKGRPGNGGAIPRPALDLGFEGLEFGGYDLIEKVGEGGMGVVYRANQRRLNREVAIKLLPAVVMGGHEAVERFRIEAESMAVVDHPNIVPVYEAGEIEGQPFLSMKFIDGAPLSQRIEEFKSAPRMAAAVVAKIADAVHAAHQLGFLHRDLKPGNVLLNRQDEPLLTDFGLAKRLDPDEGESLTRSGDTLGTPAYMAPEQAGGAQASVATDIYGLGSILYHLLTGRAPFQGNSVPQILRRVVEDEPPTPMSQSRVVDRDLNAITLRCLEKRGLQRYSSARELAEDLQRWLAGEPVQARPITGIHRALRWARRKPFQAGFALTASALLLTLAVGGPLVALSQKELRDEADLARGEAENNSRSLRWNLYSSQMREASLAAASPSGLPSVERLLDNWKPLADLADLADLRGWEWHHLNYVTRPRGEVLRQLDHPIRAFALAPDGQRYALAVRDESGAQVRIDLFDESDHQMIQSVAAFEGLIHRLQFSSDGRHLAANRSPRSRLLIFDLDPESEADPVSFSAKHEGSQQAWSPDGSRVAFQQDKNVWIYDLPSRRRIAQFQAKYHSIMQYDWLPDGQGVVVHERRLLTLLSANPRDPEIKLHQDERSATTSALSVAPDGRRVLLGDIQGNLRIFDLSSRAMGSPVKAHESRIRAVAWSPEGTHFVSAGDDLSLQIRDADLRGSAEWLRGHRGAVNGVSWPETNRIVSWSEDGSIRNWRPLRDRVASSAQPYHLAAVSWRPDGQLVTGAFSDFVSVDLAARTAADRHLLVSDSTSDLQWMPDGEHVAFFSLRHLAIGKPVSFAADTPPRGLRRLHRHDRANAISLSRLKPWLASAGGDGIKVADYESGESVAEMTAAPVIDLQFHPTDERQLAYAEERSARIGLLDMRSGKTSVFVKPNGNRCQALDFHPRGHWLATGSDEGRIEFWEYPSGRAVNSLAGHTSGISALDFSPDGSRLASASLDTTIRIWDVATGSQLAVLKGHPAGVLDVAWSPDGKTLASCGQAGEMRIWHSKE